MARAMGTATVTFGLVSIAVKIFSTTQTGSKVSFRQIDKLTQAPVKQKLVSSKDGSEVLRENILKGYEVSKDQFVIITDEELDSVAVEATKALDIKEFIPLDAIDTIYFDQPYYLTPEKVGPASRPYWLIYNGLRELGLCALAQYATRGNQKLVVIRADDRGLVMQQLHYADEVRSWDELSDLMKPIEVTQPELDLAKQLISTRQNEVFNPAYYEDTVKQKLLGLIEAKMAGQSIVLAKPEEAPVTETVDLMALLKASVAAAKR